MLEINVKAKRVEPYTSYEWSTLAATFKEAKMQSMADYCLQKEQMAVQHEQMKSSFEKYLYFTSKINV